MTLSFSTHWPASMGEWAGQPNYFPEKIIAGLDLSIIRKCTLNDLLAEVVNPTDAEFMNGSTNPNHGHKPKPHTIRHDPHGRWKAGMKIHPVINNRTLQRFQFAPTMVCTGIQYIHILNGGDGRQVSIGDRPDYEDCMPFYFEDDDDDSLYGLKEMEVLAQNDGFESVEQFFAYFNKHFRGVLIHWTDIRY